MNTETCNHEFIRSNLYIKCARGREERAGRYAPSGLKEVEFCNRCGILRLVGFTGAEICSATMQ